MASTRSNRSTKSRLARYVLGRLPHGFMVVSDDVRWLNFCDQFLTDVHTSETVVAATIAALEANPNGHCDPFEMLIEARICDVHCRSLR